MDKERRDFLKKGLLAAGATALGAGLGALGRGEAPEEATVPVLTADGKLALAPAGAVHPCPSPIRPGAAAAREGVPGRRWVMVIDLANCDGCKGCTKACGKMHFVPPEREWIKVFQMQDSPETAPYWLPKPCFHCDNPPCTKVCPVDATFKRQDGIVLIDNERCIGCRFCMAACPYSTRFFNWGRPQEPAEAKAQTYSPECGFPRSVGTVEKCDFCPNLAERGILPDCASSCAMGAIYFGDQNEDAVTNSKGETVRLSRLLEERAGYRYHEELGTQPRVYYLPPKNRRYPAPPEPGERGAHAPH